MDVRTALEEFASLLSVASKALENIVRDQAPTDRTGPFLVEVQQIAVRLGEIAESVNPN